MFLLKFCTLLLSLFVRTITADEDFCRESLDLLLLIDGSGGAEEVASEQLRWSEIIANNFSSSGRIALIQYASSPEIEFNYTRYQNLEDMLFHIQGIQFKTGVTRTGQALSYAQQFLSTASNGARPEARKIVVVFTDGLSIDETAKSAAALRKRAKVYIVSVGSEGFVPEMLRISGDADNVFGPNDSNRLLNTLAVASNKKTKCAPKEPLTTSTVKSFVESSSFQAVTLRNLQRVPGSAHLRASVWNPDKTSYLPKTKRIRRIIRRRKGSPGREKKVRKIRKIVRRRPSTRAPQVSFSTIAHNWATLISTEEMAWTPRSTMFTTPIPSTNSVKHSNINKQLVPPKRHRAFAVKTQAGPNFEKQCPLDILFLIDSSGSVALIYEKQKKFVSTLLEAIDPEQNSHRVALVQFAGQHLQKMEWAFDTFKYNDQLMRAFQGVRHFTGTTYIGAALRLAVMLLEQRRTGVPTILVMLSDGYSQDDITEPASTIRSMSNVEQYAISLSSDNNIKILEQIAGDKVYLEDNAEDIRQSLIDRFRCYSKDQ